MWKQAQNVYKPSGLALHHCESWVDDVTRVSIQLPCAGLTAVVQQHFLSKNTQSRLIVLSDRQSFLINKSSFNARSQSRKTPRPSSCPSVCPNVLARLSTEGFPQNLVLGNFMTILRETIRQTLLSCYMHNYVRFMVAGNASWPLRHRLLNFTCVGRRILYLPQSLVIIFYVSQK